MQPYNDNIGDKIRKITVEPISIPDPTEIPEETPIQPKEPVKV